MITRQGMKDLAATIRKYLKFMAMVRLLFEDNSIRALRENDSKRTNLAKEASRPHPQSQDSKLKSILEIWNYHMGMQDQGIHLKDCSSKTLH